MASYARCLLFLLFAISFFLEIHARESKLFSKVTKTRKKNNANEINFSPSVSPTLAPALSWEPEVVEHGYGLYGRDPYEHTPTKTVMPTKKTISDEQEKYGDNDDSPGYPTYPPKSETLTKNTILGNEKYVPAQELSQTEDNGDTNYLPTSYGPPSPYNYGGTKKFPNEYDTMEEYDREQGYIDPQDVYVP